ncbi:hypothetical protein [Coralloluteibacterium stylophorae]|uniref:Uncharacterized protein n=1 Tax=Coralloluteibacterium stylophorae TaxID=1776034 RepID=A0AAP2FWK6_9GAMM|nr:hypothetical protein [Coralloluteibacterium stylophorae]MBS7455822.1 hypothetical protein [Coralloluteibacterium stylophorae]
MPHSARSSTTSPTVRLDWRPSRLLVALLAVLMVAAACAPWLSSLPSAVALAASAAAFAHGAVLVRREARRPRFELVWPPGDVPARLVQGDVGVPVEIEALRIQAGVAILRLRHADGHRRSLLWWPDTLGAAGRRALRLAWAGARAPEAVRAPPGAPAADQPAIRQTR